MRVSSMMVFALAAVLATSGRAEDEGEPGEFTWVLKAQDGGPKEAAEKVLSTKEALDELVKLCGAEDVKEELGKVEIDFEKDLLVVVALGERMDHLAKTEQNEQGISKVLVKGDDWTVHYTVVSTDVKWGPSYPIFVIRIPKKGQHVLFQRKDVEYGG